MKRTTLLILAFVGLVNLAYSQVSIVPKAGISISNVAFDADDDVKGQKSVVGFTGGLGLNIPLTADNFLSLQPEILYAQKGFAAKNNSAITDYDGTYKLNYLEVPLLLKIGFGSDVVKGYVNLGPSVGYLLGGRVKGSWDAFEIIEDDVNEPIEFTDDPNAINEVNANRIELGANFGGGIGFSLGSSLLFFDARYNAGLTDYSQERKSKNQTFYLTAGFKIPLGQ